MKRRRLTLIVLPLLAGTLLAGCGGGRKTVPVSGVITLEGAPLAGAQVTFHPMASDGRMAIGISDSNGRFSLTTYKPNDGALPGRYRITVALGLNETPADAKLAADVKEMFKERERLSKLRLPDVHANYKSLDKSPLFQEVPPPGDVKIDLKKSGS
jgi:hypothetical protein